MKRVVLSSAWSYHNKGDAAIVDATMDYLRSVLGEIEVTLLAFQPEPFARRLNPRGVRLTVLPMPSQTRWLRAVERWLDRTSWNHLWRGPWVAGAFGLAFLGTGLALLPFARRVDPALDRILRALAEADLVVLVGGTTLLSYFGVFAHFLPAVYAVGSGRPVIVLGQTVGPFYEPISRIVGRWLLQRMELIGVREAFSYRHVVDQLGVPAHRVTLAGDIAFLLATPDHRPRPVEPEGPRAFNPPPRRIGLTARMWGSETVQARYLDSLRGVVSRLTGEGWEICLIPFSAVGADESDVVFATRWLGSLGPAVRDRVRLITVTEEAPADVVRILRDLDLTFMIGTRMHSVILAAVAGIPSVIIPYQDFKSHGVADQLGLNDYCLEYERVSEPELDRRVRALVDRLPAAAADVRRGVEATRRTYAGLAPRIRALAGGQASRS